jgi:hypothetical protein
MMTMSPRWLVGLVLAVSLHGPLWAQEPAAPNPALDAPPDAQAPAATTPADPAAIQVAQAYLMAINARGMAGGVPLLHPEDLVSFKRLMVPILEAERDAGRRTLLNATFGREAQLTDARVADPDDFFGRFARVVSARQIEAPTRFDTLAPLGSIPEAEQLHVLFRTLTGVGQAQTQRLVVVTLRRSGGDWKVSLAVGIDDLVASLRGRSQARTGPESLAQPVTDAVPPASLEQGLPQVPEGASARPQGPRPAR